MNDQVNPVADENATNTSNGGPQLGLNGLLGDSAFNSFKNMNAVYNFENDPTSYLNWKWWLSKTNSQPSLESQACYLVYQCEIDSYREQHNLSLCRLGNHFHHLFEMLRNHATVDVVLSVKTLLEMSPCQSLREAVESCQDMDVQKLAWKIAQDVFQQYADECRVRIPCHPTVHSGMEILWGRVCPQVLVPILGPSENMSFYGVADVRLEFAEGSLFSPNGQVNPVADENATHNEQPSPATRVERFVRRFCDLFFVNEAIITEDIDKANEALATHCDNYEPMIGTSKIRMYDANGGFRDMTTFYVSRRTFIPWVFAKNICNYIRKATVFFNGANSFCGN